MPAGIWQPRFKRFLIAMAVALSSLIGLAAMSEAAFAQSSHAKQVSSSKAKKQHAQRHTHKKVARRHREDTQGARDDSDDDTPPAKSNPTADQVVATIPARTTADGRTSAQNALPSIVSNAHAELTTGIAPARPDPSLQSWPANDTLTATDRAVSPDMSPTGVQIATADQLNDIDRDMNAQAAESAPAAPAATIPFAAVSAQPQTQAQNTPKDIAQTTGQSQAFSASQDNNTPWNAASLIGKIFIAFGTILTLASVARLIIA